MILILSLLMSIAIFLVFWGIRIVDVEIQEEDEFFAEDAKRLEEEAMRVAQQVPDMVAKLRQMADGEKATCEEIHQIADTLEVVTENWERDHFQMVQWEQMFIAMRDHMTAFKQKLRDQLGD